MLIPTLLMLVLALILFGIAFIKGVHGGGLHYTFELTKQILPIFILAMIVVGMVQVLIPSELLSHWIGKESGWKGVFLGTIAGGFSPGGPYVNLPIAAALYHSGASMGTMVAFLTGWSLWAIWRLPMEVGIMGWRFALVRFLSVCFFPPIAGYLALGLEKLFKL